MSATKIPLLTELEPFVPQTHARQLVENLFFVGDEVTSLKFFGF
jgi:hypothetical protein